MDARASSGRLDRGATEAAAALELSHLATLPNVLKERLVSLSHVVNLPAAATLHREGDEAAHLQLVVSGLLRVYVTALDGRTLTVRYCRPGSILGAVSLFSSAFAMPASVQSVTDATVLSMPASSIKQAAEEDVAMARALIDELSDRVLSFVAEIPGSAFATVRQKVARHLLDLASVGQSGSELVVIISQQDLAAAVGSVREVVVRELRAFRDEGLIETGRQSIRLLDAQQLATEAYPANPGTQVPDRSNPSR